MPRIVEAVGVSVGSLVPERKDMAKLIEKAMADAVAECFKLGITDSEQMKAHMMRAREKAMRAAIHEKYGALI